MIKNPKISVIMSVYNGEHYLAQAIESILNQTFQDFEFIIINDGSTDRSEEIIKSYDDDRIILINQQHKGLIYSLNYGLQKAKAKYIARMDGDDISLPDRLAIQLSFMEKHDDIGVLGTGCQFIDHLGFLTGEKLNRQGEHFEILNSILKAKGYVSIIHPTVMIRKDLLLRVGGYNERFPVCEDVDLFLRIAKISKLHVIPDMLLLYRLHQESVSVTKRHIQLQSGIITRVCYYLREKGLKDPSLYDEEAWKQFRRIVDKTIRLYGLYRADDARIQLSSQLSGDKGLLKYLKFLVFIAFRPHLIVGLFAKRKWNLAINRIVNEISSR